MKMDEEVLTSSKSHVTLLKTSTIGGLLKTLAGRLLVCKESDGKGSPGLMCLLDRSWWSVVLLSLCVTVMSSS